MLEKIDADNTTIKKSPDNSSITVTAPQITIVIKLDEKAKKATTTLDMTGNNSKNTTTRYYILALKYLLVRFKRTKVRY